MTQPTRFLLSATALTACLIVSGCRVENHKDGNKDNVKITTPFGGMNVKTNETEVLSGVGLSAYPGATAVTNDHDNSAADVSLNFGSFHLGVKAASYRTPDDPEKVFAFYRKDMAKYGTVLFCKDHQAVGSAQHTQDGLTCNDDSKDNHIHTGSSGNDGELKAGSKLHQHIVTVDREGAGSKFGLVLLDLPGHLDSDDGDKQ